MVILFGQDGQDDWGQCQMRKIFLHVDLIRDDLCIAK